MTINLHLPETVLLKPSITVFGVGGAGGNAVNNMILSKLEGVKFVVANTDAQALETSLAEKKIQLGANLTRGLGAGASPDIGGAAAEEAIEEILDNLQGSNMVFVTAGMGGGTGTGAAPVIARAAKENGILTVGVVTKPFNFEGRHRTTIADTGLAELRKYVDTLIVIPNQNLFRIANEKTTFSDAFKMADDVLHAGVRGVTDLMIMPGLINLDFADIRTVMSEMGRAMMGTGEAEGENRALLAAESAISNPLLDISSMKGAKGVLINITGGMDMTLFEVDEAANRIRQEVDPDANIIFGSTFNEALSGRIRVSVVATGIESEAEKAAAKPQNTRKNILDSDIVRKPIFGINNNFDQIDQHRETPTESFNFEEFANTRRHDRSVFVAPKPLEPKGYSLNTSKDGAKDTISDIEDEIKEQLSAAPEIQPDFREEIDFSELNNTETDQDYIEDEEFEDEQPSKKMGLFGRVASIMGGKKPKSAKAVNSSKSLNGDVMTDEHEDFDEEILSVPAYLRKKK